MEDKEAIRRIKDHFRVHDDGRPTPYLDEAVSMAIKALEKQIPKKPKKLTYKLLLDDGWIHGCPTCGCACGENKYHPDVTKDDIYCTQCGQMLDWE